MKEYSVENMNYKIKNTFKIVNLNSDQKKDLLRWWKITQIVNFRKPFPYRDEGFLCFNAN
ncbi:MAG: hypothetical protein GXO75_20230 [Calditrichaeota bacterium]|nr:hypothetical protein [Calditrichota bacterium]